jgi:uncharacterized protein (DUF1499 family)
MSLASAALVGGILGAGLVLCAGPLFRFTGSLPASFGALGFGAVAGLLGGVAGLAHIVATVRHGQPVSPSIAAGVLLGLAACGIPFHRVWAARSLPPIHDISTDLENPPTFDAIVPLRAGEPNGLAVNPADAPRQRAAYPDLASLTVPAASDQAFDTAVAAARSLGWDIVAADRAAGRIEATASTRWFGFKDDVVVRLTAAPAGTRIDARSVSRVGVGDLGTNAARIRAYFAGITGSYAAR